MRIDKNSLISPEQDIHLSSVYIGFLVLKLLKCKDSITIFELYSVLRKEVDVVNFRMMICALSFLFMSGLIYFNKPYICLNK